MATSRKKPARRRPVFVPYKIYRGPNGGKFWFRPNGQKVYKPLPKTVKTLRKIQPAITPPPRKKKGQTDQEWAELRARKYRNRLKAVVKELSAYDMEASRRAFGYQDGTVDASLTVPLFSPDIAAVQGTVLKIKEAVEKQDWPKTTYFSFGLVLKPEGVMAVQGVTVPERVKGYRKFRGAFRVNTTWRKPSKRLMSKSIDILVSMANNIINRHGVPPDSLFVKIHTSRSGTIKRAR